VGATIAVRDAAARYGERLVLSDVSLDVASGEVVAIVGRSGIGKTTLLRLVAGLLVPSAGAIAIEDAPVREARRRKVIGLVAQDARLHPWRTVRGNVALGLEVNRHGVTDDGVDDWIARVGLADAAHAYPRVLSGGMRQRVALARALVLRPRVLLLDEPLGALDELTREDLRDELARLVAATGAAVLYVTHDLEEAALLADRVLALAGRPARVALEVAVPLARPRARAARLDPLVVARVERLRGAL